MKRENPFVSIYRNVNGGTNEEKYNAIREGLTYLPSYIDVELTNFCNFRCCFCPTGTKAMKRMKGFMSDEVVDALVENVKKYNIAGVRFIRWGEPTMHPKYIEIMEKVRKAGALIHINTNGSLIDEKQIKKMLDIHRDSIKFSFQGADVGKKSLHFKATRIAFLNMIFRKFLKKFFPRTVLYDFSEKIVIM